MEKLYQMLRQIQDQKAKTGEIQTAELESLYDDFIHELKTTIELNPIKISPQENVDNLLALVWEFRNALAKKPEFNEESKALIGWERNLRLLAMTAPTSKNVTQIETALYSLVESKPELRKLYGAMVEDELLRICSSKLRSLEHLSRERPLSDEELSQMHAMKDQIVKSQRALKVYSPET